MNQDTIRLLKKYINNLCSEEELEQVTHILKSAKYNEEWSAVMHDEAINDMADKITTDNTAFDANRLLTRIIASITPVKQIQPYKWMIGVAASILIVFSIGYLFFKGNVASSPKTYMVKQFTRSGKRKTIILADGTKVILNNESEISYASVFADHKREVYLTGEAFFDVKHDSKRPFLVHTPHLNVQVLGTSFDVKAYRNDITSTVGVITGKVGVSNKNTPTHMLLPGNVLSYDHNSMQYKQTNNNLAEISDWQHDVLIFKQETIADISIELQRCYAVTIRIHRNTLQKKRVTATFPKKSLPEILKILSQTAGFSYTINKNEVNIY